MDVLILIIFLSLIALLSILLDRRWQRRAWQRRQARVAAAPVGNPQNDSLADQIMTGWQKRMGWRTQPMHDQAKLRTWLTTSLADQPATQAWVAELTEAEFSQFEEQLQAFCNALNIDPAWLGEQSLTQDPALQTTIQTIVLHYAQAQHQAASVQAELRAFKSYLALAERPYSYEYQPLIQRLYTQVVNAGLTDPARPEALLATEKIRIEHMLRAIQAAATAHRPIFYQILNELNSTAG